MESKLLRNKEVVKPTSHKSDEDMWSENESEKNLTGIDAGNFEQVIRMKNEEIVELQNQVNVHLNKYFS